MAKLSWPSVAIGLLGLLLAVVLVHSLFLGPPTSKAVPPSQAAAPSEPVQESETTVVEVITPPSQVQPTSSPQVLIGPDGQPFRD